MTSFDSTGESGPLLVALASGSGGAGRTTLALELARVLGRRGIATVLVDCALRTPLHADLLGRSEGRRKPQASLFSPGAHLEDFLERAEGTPISILTLGDAVGDPSQPLSSPPVKFLRRLRRLDDRVVLLDLPPGPTAYWLDLFILSDVPIVLSAPDPWSVRTTLSFVQAAVGHAGELLSGPLGRTRLTTYLALNGCRDPSEREMGEVLCHAIWRKFDHYPRYLGPVDFDDRRWFHLRHGAVCPALSSSEGHGVQVEDLAKRILDVEDFNEARPRTETQGTGRVRARYMGLSEMAPATDLRAQYRRLWEGYRRESAISQVVLGDEERKELIAELETTYRALQTAMDEPMATGETPPVAEPEESRRATPPPIPGVAAGGDEQPDVDASAEVELEAAHCGEWIRFRREARQLSLKELSLRTRIGIRNLETVEAMDRSALPPAVYLRGYLREIARALDVSVESLLDRYLSELAS